MDSHSIHIRSPFLSFGDGQKRTMEKHHQVPGPTGSRTVRPPDAGPEMGVGCLWQYEWGFHYSINLYVMIFFWRVSEFFGEEGWSPGDVAINKSDFRSRSEFWGCPNGGRRLGLGCCVPFSWCISAGCVSHEELAFKCETTKLISSATADVP